MTLGWVHKLLPFLSVFSSFLPLFHSLQCATMVWPHGVGWRFWQPILYWKHIPYYRKLYQHNSKVCLNCLSQQAAWSCANAEWPSEWKLSYFSQCTPHPLVLYLAVIKVSLFSGSLYHFATNWFGGWGCFGMLAWPLEASSSHVLQITSGGGIKGTFHTL